MKNITTDQLPQKVHEGLVHDRSTPRTTSGFVHFFQFTTQTNFMYSDIYCATLKINIDHFKYANINYFDLNKLRV